MAVPVNVPIGVDTATGMESGTLSLLMNAESSLPVVMGAGACHKLLISTINEIGMSCIYRRSGGRRSLWDLFSFLLTRLLSHALRHGEWWMVVGFKKCIWKLKD